VEGNGISRRSKRRTYKTWTEEKGRARCKKREERYSIRIGYRQVSNEIRATLIDHNINDGFSLREAGQRVQPNINIVPQSMSLVNKGSSPLVLWHIERLLTVSSHPRRREHQSGKIRSTLW